MANRTIIINTRKYTGDRNTISFKEVVLIAFPKAKNIESFTVTYARGHIKKPEGIMHSKDFVYVKDGMIFNVSLTNNS